MDDVKKVHFEEGRPVQEIALTFRWQTGAWKAIFDEQIKLIREDIDRTRAEDKLICYLSCPISTRGGGYHGTNVEVARYTERRLLMEWGDRFWILNPCQYQMESKEGLGLFRRHAERLGIDLSSLKNLPPPSGGDYMRMWTRVLCEDDGPTPDIPGKNDDKGWNCGRRFDLFYFLGPTDVRWFFSSNGAGSLSAEIEEYFARKVSTDPDFNLNYSVEGIVWSPDLALSKLVPEVDEQKQLREQWENKRKEFFRFYAVRASIVYSLGSHDEWNILRLLNARRKMLTSNENMRGGDTGIYIPGYFDGKQIDPAALEMNISNGYAR